jgi:hypothetical protein
MVCENELFEGREDVIKDDAFPLFFGDLRKDLLLTGLYLILVGGSKVLFILF